ncbi:hypothetical protein LSH36_672g00005, partial [Paralvinella palmiformis]
MTSNLIATDDVAATPELRHSRVVRRAAQRNLAEKLAEIEQQRHLDTQRRHSQAQLERDQKQLRAQLRRLQDQQRLLSENDDTIFSLDSAIFECNIFPEMIDVREDDCFLPDELVTECQQDCVNPYPIVFASTVRSRTSVGSTSGRRNDLDPDEEIQGQGRSMSRSASRCHVTGSLSTNSTPRSSVSAINPLIPGEASPADESWWLGDPEAIQSIRRPRKSVAQLKMEHRWNRSHSVKERPVSRDTTPKRKSVNRSKSMREPPSTSHVTDPNS